MVTDSNTTDTVDDYTSSPQNLFRCDRDVFWFGQCLGMDWLI